MGLGMQLEVKRELVVWAIKRSRRDESAFSEKSSWAFEASETLRPTFAQLERFAKDARVPLGFLFLSEPPEEKVPLPDFRKVAGRSDRSPSPDLLDTIYLCQNRQSWFRDYARKHDIDPIGFVGSLSVGGDVKDAASRIRDALDFDLEDRSHSSWAEALADLIRTTDDSGVLVMVSGVVGSNTTRVLNPQEFRGFAISDSVAPLIFVNGADTKSAQMFTIIHELAHIWAGRSALNDFGPADVPDGDIERWCDKVAAEVLVPEGQLRQKLSPKEEVSEATERLARVFKVSTLVILRRLFDVGRITRKDFWARYEDELARLKLIIKKSRGGDFYKTQNYRVSRRFAKALLSSTLEGETLYGEAMRLLSVSSSEALENYAERLGVG
jgi:Zn-dependent peptidase ImmA (M78 family)